MASYSFRIDVPEGTTAIANGVPTGQHTHNGRTIYRFEQRAPMATELAGVAVGAFTVISRGNHAGVTVRDVVPTRLVADLDPKLAPVTNHIDFMEALVGDYPFPTYGSMVVEASLGFALENQTLSLYDSIFFSRDPASYEPIMVHELAHQWFGDSVAPARWADVWQNEGHATWYEFSFRLGLDSEQFTGFMQQVYSFGDIFRAVFGPVASPAGNTPNALFNQNVYFGGALALYALRQQIGDAAFQQVERTWVRTYRGRSPSTADFIALASRVSGQDLTVFLNDWFYGTTTPAMPGHPDWTVQPLPPPSAVAAALPTFVLPFDDLGILRR
jgi:aminopeptidase N